MKSAPELVEEGIWCNFSFKLWHECNITCIHDVEYRIWCVVYIYIYIYNTEGEGTPREAGGF